MLFRKPDFVQYSSVLHAVCGENSAAVLPQKTSFAVRHVFSYYIERFRKSQAHFFIFSKNSETHAESCHFIRKRGRSAGDAASILAPASRSSSSPRNPQVYIQGFSFFQCNPFQIMFSRSIILHACRQVIRIRSVRIRLIR